MDKYQADDDLQTYCTDTGNSPVVAADATLGRTITNPTVRTTMVVIQKLYNLISTLIYISGLYVFSTFLSSHI